MPKRKQMTSPRGVAVWPHLNEPNTRFDDDGVYSVKLAIPQEDAQGFIDELTEYYQEGYQEHCRDNKKNKLKPGPMPWADQEDENGNPTGLVEFKFKMKAKYNYEGTMVENRVILFDADAKKCDARIGGGSELKVGCEPYVWYTGALGCGLSLRLKAVQVLKLVEYNSGSDASSFFNVEEGFTAATEVTPDGADDFDF